jgi:streptogramin lyase
MARRYRETHFQGFISVEQELKQGVMEGDLGIQISEDGRVWICINGTALIRLNPKIKEYSK